MPASAQEEDVEPEVTPEMVAALISLLATKEFSEFIASLDHPFRATTNEELVGSLNRTFIDHFAQNATKRLQLKDFDPKAIEQLPNLLKKYVNECVPHFSFATGNIEVDCTFVSLIHLIIRRGKSYKSFEDFARAFPKSRVLLDEYNYFDNKYKEIKARKREKAKRRTRNTAAGKNRKARPKSGRAETEITEASREALKKRLSVRPNVASKLV